MVNLLLFHCFWMEFFSFYFAPKLLLLLFLLCALWPTRGAANYANSRNNDSLLFVRFGLLVCVCICRCISGALHFGFDAPLLRHRISHRMRRAVCCCTHVGGTKRAQPCKWYIHRTEYTTYSRHTHTNKQSTPVEGHSIAYVWVHSSMPDRIFPSQKYKANRMPQSIVERIK